MSAKIRFEMLDNAKELASYQFCTETEYRDLFAVRNGKLSEEDFDKKYQKETAILCLNMNGLTQTGLRCGSLICLFLILDMQKVVAPVLTEFNASHARAFADDFIAFFDNPDNALNAAFEIHKRIQLFNQEYTSRDKQLKCSIGVGFGRTYAIGIDKAMGDEMNQVSKLGEDIARTSETLLTERIYTAVQNRTDCNFIKRMDEDIPFVFYEAVKKRNS